MSMTRYVVDIENDNEEIVNKFTQFLGNLKSKHDTKISLTVLDEESVHTIQRRLRLGIKAEKKKRK